MLPLNVNCEQCEGVVESRASALGARAVGYGWKGRIAGRRSRGIEESRADERVRYGVEQDHQILAPAPLVSSHIRR